MWLLLKAIGVLPRPVARFVGARTTAFLFWLRPGLRAAATDLYWRSLSGTKSNAAPSFAAWCGNLDGWRRKFARFPRYTKANIERTVLLDGFENFASAREEGKGVLFLTGHMSAWELAPFAQALFGNPPRFWSGRSTIRASMRSSPSIAA